MTSKSSIIFSALTILILVTAATSAGYSYNAFAATGPVVSAAGHKSSSIGHIGVKVKFNPPQIHKADNQIFDGGDPDFNDGNDMTSWTQANDFTLASSQVVSDVHIWTVESTPWDNTATWFIYSDNSGQPGSVIATGSASGLVKTDLGPWSVNGFEMYSYSFNLDNPVNLPAGNYWLGLHFAQAWSPDFVPGVGIFWVTGPTIGALGQEDFTNLSQWTTNEQDHAFKLTGNSGQTEPVRPVGGMGIPIDATALLLAGVQGSALWMIPAIVVAGAGIGIFSFKKSKKKHD